MPAVPAGWTLGIGDRDGTYVARSQLHEEMTGRPGLPEYLAKVVGRSGTFTSSNFQGVTLLAGYYRSEFSDWFYAANVPLSVVQAPLWSSLAAIGAIGLVAMLVSTALAYVVGKGFARAAADLAARAEALGQGRTVAPMSTRVRSSQRLPTQCWPPNARWPNANTSWRRCWRPSLRRSGSPMIRRPCR